MHMADGRGCQRGSGLKCCVVSREGRERTAPPSAAVLASHFAVANCCAHGSEQPAYQSWVLEKLGAKLVCRRRRLTAAPCALP